MNSTSPTDCFRRRARGGGGLAVRLNSNAASASGVTRHRGFFLPGARPQFRAARSPRAIHPSTVHSPTQYRSQSCLTVNVVISKPPKTAFNRASIGVADVTFFGKKWPKKPTKKAVPNNVIERYCVTALGRPQSCHSASLSGISPLHHAAANFAWLPKRAFIKFITVVAVVVAFSAMSFPSGGSSTERSR